MKDPAEFTISIRDIRRLWSRISVSEPNECWEHQGPYDGHGYGHIRLGGRAGLQIGAHRLVFMLMTGPIKDGLDVCHKCDNPKCCNPHHLWEGTRGQNLQDMASKNRSNHGSKNWNSKLDEDAVRQMRAEYDGKWGSISRLARKFKVTQSVASTIINRKAWVRV